MGDIEFLLLLLAAATVGVRFADHAGIPYPIVLVVFGLALGLIPGLPQLELHPDLVFLVFLPPLLHSAGWFVSPRELRSEERPLHPHLTLARFSTPAPVAQEALDLVAGAAADSPPWEARELACYRSILGGPRGARYRVVREFPLAG